MSCRALLRWQFDLTWSLFEYHLERLEPTDFCWEPAELSWTMHRGSEGAWTPDWADTEPDPVPVPTIAWLTWHLGWWWSAAIDQLHGRPVPKREDVDWPGPGEETVSWLRELRERWLTLTDALTDDDLDTTAAFPWPAESGHTVAQLLGWVNAELMKNVAEIGQLRLTRAAQPAGR
ncbi:DinB superfamily protein [Micromonospora phaseoli]|uniref:DinB superfamily protein n=1 Tax=Micromonospora phaseoli TaxID=1144548 RepID=A0A1H6ZM64_9ACTN|nr:DinB family protein [Micromonospora phaseoli]PZV97210.1 DinB family protein [Micromonospora phaseoli]GIJ77210.1 DNA damage-inducible protein DinB [Micromonospora phaseoli]SEJ52637.1 DinB superfamily protein [Micromonospora phaseoli]